MNNNPDRTEEISPLLQKAEQIAREREARISERGDPLQQNEMLANLVRLSSQPLGVGFMDGSLGLVNPAFERLTGYTVDELKSMDWATDLTPPEWREYEQQQLAELHRTGTPVKYEKEYIRKDGSRVPVELLVHLVPDAEGKPAYYFSYVSDISERKAAEDRLKISQERLLLATDGANIGIWYWDLAADSLEWSDLCKTHLCLPPGREPSFEHFYSVMHPGDRERIEGLIGQAVENRSDYAAEYRIIHPDGSLHWLSAPGRVYCSADGTLLGMGGILSDITESKRAEEEIRELNATLERKVEERTAEVQESEQRFRALITASSEVVYSMSPDWSEMRHLVGKQFIPDMQGNSHTWLDRYIHPDDQAEVLTAIGQAVQTKSMFQLEHRVIRLDGSLGWTFSRALPLCDQQGEIKEWFGTASDVTARKEAEENLRESEERFNLAVKAAQEGVWDWNLETDAVWYSPRYKEMLGYAEDEIEPHASAWLRLMHPDDRQPSLDVVAAVKRGEREYEIEFRLRHKDGHYLNILSRGFPVRREQDGKVIRIVGTHLDLTERKQTEEKIRNLNATLERKVEERTAELRETTEHLEAMVNALPDFMFRFDEHGTILEFRSSSPENLYLPPDQFLGNKVSDVLPEEPARIIMAAVGEAISTGHHRGAVYSLPMPQGTKWYELSAAAFGQPVQGSRQCIVLARDVTDRKGLEDALRMTQVSVDSASDAIYWILPDGRIANVNPAACRMLGYSHEELQQLSVPDIGPEYPVDVWRQHWLELREKGTLKFESVHRAKDGSIIPVEIVANYVRLGDEERNCAFARDISERKRYENELLQSRDAAEAGNRAKSEFLANMSHEIRTPMNGIMGMAQILEFTPLDEEQREYLDVIKKSSGNLLTIINDILDLSKIEAGKIEITRQEFSLRDTVNEVIKTQILAITTKRLGIDTIIPTSVPDLLNGDQLRLKQILLNLVGNAIKFTEKGGIHIRAAIKEQGDQKVLLTLEVADSGIGIAPEHLENIFKPFTQVDSSDTRRFGGTGLGLAICTRLTSIMGGRIWVESREGVGSNFFVEIPFGRVEADEEWHNRRAGDRAFPRWDGPSLRVLLVDDDELNAFVASDMLKKAGHTITWARHGREALGKWEGELFDLILMDVQMPVMNGIEATVAIREREGETGAHIPIIAMTARALNEERKFILSQGFDGYVAKPFEIDGMYAELKRCLGATDG